MISAYEKYRTAGFVCLPTTETKSPALPKGHSWKGGWDSLEEYEKSHGIALICGELSGNLECIDFDNTFQDIKTIFNSFFAIQEVNQLFAKYKFPVQKTKRNGYHLIYRCAVIAGNQKLAERMNEAGRPGTLIETRGEGGYFCVEPTPGYKILKNDILNPPTITPEERDILLSACRSFHEVCTPSKKPEFEDLDRPGEIYNRSSESVSDMIRALKGAGWAELSDGIWRRPGKDKGISATLGRAHPGIFYNFSANGHPFENNRGFTAFQVVGLLEYNADFKRFAKELYDRQNPKKPVSATIPIINNAAPTPEEPDQIYADFEKKFRVDLTTEPPQAPAVLYFKKLDQLIPSFTLQNFSLITGKAKSRKTFLTVLIVASFLGFKNDRLKADSERKGTVLIIDTEQSHYHLHKMMKRICRLIGINNPERLLAYGIKTLTPPEKIKFIEYKLKTTPDIIMLVIDGVRDLVYDINSPQEATETSVRLMKWCANENIHIINILHQNKGDGNARGHLGTELVNKAETVLSVTLDPGKTITSVETEYSREIDFDTFSFIINDEGLPEICETPGDQVKTAKRTEPHLIPTETHRRVLDQVFKTPDRKYRETWMDVKLSFSNEGVSFGENKAKEYLAFYIKGGWVVYRESTKTYNYEKAMF